MICLRFDVDTRWGLVHRTPPLLDLLDRHEVRATFFVVMGRDASLVEVLRHRLRADPGSKSTLDLDARGGALRVGLAALFPRRVGSGNGELLRDIERRGHELQPHGWSHIQWQRTLAQIDPEEHVRRARASLSEITGHDHLGFAAPGRVVDDRALAAFDRVGLDFSGDLDGPAPFRPPGATHLQLPITRFETFAQMRARGLTDDAIAQVWLDDIDRNPDWCCLYEHPDDLTDRDLRILDAVFIGIRDRGLRCATLSEAAEAWTGPR